MQIKKPRYTGENPLPGRSTTAVVECREERGAGGEFSVQGWKLNFSASTSISPLPVPSAAYLHLARPPPALCVHTTALECIVRGTRRPTKYETRRTGKEREKKRGERERKKQRKGVAIEKRNPAGFDIRILLHPFSLFLFLFSSKGLRNFLNSDQRSTGAIVSMNRLGEGKQFDCR